MRHVVVMASTASLGLMTLFVVDLADMYFLSLLGESELAAAIGYAGTILFFTTSICIGIAIAAGALVSRSLGEENIARAKQYSTNVSVFGVVLATLVSIGVWVFIPTFLDLLGAKGESKAFAIDYLQIIIPSMIVMALAMSGSGILRAAGDAKRSMYATVSGGIVNAVLDPILIFSFSMGIKGAAWASVVARITVAAIAFYGVAKHHELIARFEFRKFAADLKDMVKIAIPAILTNVATPFGNAYVIASIAKFGDSAVAGMSIVGRLVPVAFGVVFALSGAVGPIIGQNVGAKKMDRVLQTLKDAIVFATVTVTTAAVLLYLLQNMIITGFNATGDAAVIISLFCTWVAISFIFNGMLFISNACFNNLGYAHYSTLINFAKATLGTIPFVYLGGVLGQFEGVLIGQAVGTVVTGTIALIICFKMVHRCLRMNAPTGNREKPFNPKIPLWPQTNTRG